MQSCQAGKEMQPLKARVKKCGCEIEGGAKILVSINLPQKKLLANLSMFSLEPTE